MTFKGSGGVSSLVVLPDNRMASGCGKGIIEIWSFDSNQLKLFKEGIAQLPLEI